MGRLSLSPEGGLGPPRAGAGSLLVTLGPVTKAGRECGWLPKPMKTQECGEGWSWPQVSWSSVRLLSFLGRSPPGGLLWLGRFLAGAPPGGLWLGRFLAGAPSPSLSSAGP